MLQDIIKINKHYKNINVCLLDSHELIEIKKNNIYLLDINKIFDKKVVKIEKEKNLLKIFINKWN